MAIFVANHQQYTYKEKIMEDRQYTDAELDSIIINSIINNNIIVIDMIEIGIDIDEYIDEYFNRVLECDCFRDKTQMVNNYKRMVG